MKAVCLGSAACQGADLGALGNLGVRPGEDGWILVAVNQAAMVWPGEVDHWVSMHPENFPAWISKRYELGLPSAGCLWSAKGRSAPATLPVAAAANWKGSSGLLAVTVALLLKCDHVVLAGVPLDYGQGHFYDPRPWHEAGSYRGGWDSHKAEMGAVRSMSGWTAELLGRPTREWLAGTAEAEQPAAALEGES